jgi:hypothetical protein
MFLQKEFCSCLQVALKLKICHWCNMAVTQSTVKTAKSECLLTATFDFWAIRTHFDITENQIEQGDVGHFRLLYWTGWHCFLVNFCTSSTFASKLFCGQQSVKATFTHPIYFYKANVFSEVFKHYSSLILRFRHRKVQVCVPFSLAVTFILLICSTTGIYKSFVTGFHFCWSSCAKFKDYTWYIYTLIFEDIVAMKHVVLAAPAYKIVVKLLWKESQDFILKREMQVNQYSYRLLVYYALFDSPKVNVSNNGGWKFRMAVIFM